MRWHPLVTRAIIGFSLAASAPSQVHTNVLSPDIATPRVVVVVLTWNGKSLTLDCLESLAAVTWGNLETLVVDNASTDGTAEAIKSSCGDRVSVLINPENLGFSGGNNVGIQHALKRGADWVLLLNNDTVVDPGLVGHLIEAASQSSDVGIVGPKIYYSEPRDRIWSAGGEVLLSRGTVRHIGIRERDTGQFDTPRDVDYVSGCALMARHDVFEAIGLLDPAYTAYFEDTDFCMRAIRNGYRVRYAPAAVVWHRISSSTGGQLGRRKITLKLKSSLKFFRRYASPHHWLTIPLFFALDVLRIIGLVLAGRIRSGAGEQPGQNGSKT